MVAVDKVAVAAVGIYINFLCLSFKKKKNKNKNIRQRFSARFKIVRLIFFVSSIRYISYSSFGSTPFNLHVLLLMDVFLLLLCVRSLNASLIQNFNSITSCDLRIQIRVFCFVCLFVVVVLFVCLVYLFVRYNIGSYLINVMCQSVTFDLIHMSCVRNPLNVIYMKCSCHFIYWCNGSKTLSSEQIPFGVVFCIVSLPKCLTDDTIYLKLITIKW